MSALPIRVAVKTLVIVGLAGACLYLAFELGRLQSGYSRLDERRRVEAFESELAERDRQIDDLERQVAILETSGDIDRETYQSVERNLAELETRIQQQEEELGFYRGIVSPGDGVVGLRVQNVEVELGPPAGPHLLRVLLVQAIVQNERVTGSVEVYVHGTAEGEDVTYGLGDLAVDGQATSIPYGFRYFQNLEVGIELPAGFSPATLEIQVWPRQPRNETITQSFSWDEVTG